ncbi:MAG: DASS family sodium-coupled anion symporter [Candidatus Thermoplasmatota archaeon]|nr:DASS family sodium-coupled anion symporter [Candidatus Thermoplasmatota archaeon]
MSATSEFRSRLIAKKPDLMRYLRQDGVQAVIGLTIFALLILFFYSITPDIAQARQYYGLAFLFLAIYFWILTPISYMFTAFLLISFSVMLGIIDADQAFTGFASTTIFFLLGAFILGLTIEKHGLHKRIALKVLKRFGESPKRFLMGIILIGSFLSMTMPAHGVAAIFIPVLLSVYSVFDMNELNPDFIKASLLGLSFSTSIGSMGTLLGGARNPLAIEIYFSETGNYISFVEWFVAAIPMVLIMTLVLYIVLIKVFDVSGVDMKKIKDEVGSEVKEMGKLSMGEGKALGFLISAFIAWAVLGQIFGMGVIAVFVSVVIALSGTISWDDIAQRLPWGTIFLYGGAISLSIILSEAGTLNIIASSLLEMAGDNPFLLLALFAALTAFLSNVMSNAATTAVILPIALSAMLVMDFPDVLPVFLVALPSAFAFMFVVGTPSAALVYSTGHLDQKDFLIPGLILNLIGLAIFLSIGLGWWKLLGYW